MKIITIGHKTLAKKALPVVKIDKTLKNQVDSMFALLENQKGVGLAAPQVNISSRFFIVDIKEQELQMVCINPEILSMQNSFETLDEGCLSIPGVYAPVSRSKKVTLKYLDLDGKEQITKATGLLARIFQHEYDHLNGRLFIELVTPEDFKKIENEVDQIREKTK